MSDKQYYDRDHNSMYHADRSWGKYSIMWTRSDCKVKHLTVNPKTGMSFQRHFKRQELWFIQEGEIEVRWSFRSEADPERNYNKRLLKKFDWYYVPLQEWHQIINLTDKEAHIIEIQFGEECIEDDIERLSYYDELK